MTVQGKPGRNPAVLALRRTTTFRLTAALGLAFLVALTAVLGLVYTLTISELVRRTDDMLARDSQALLSAPPAQLPQALRAAVVANARHFTHYALVGADGRLIAGEFTPPGDLHSGEHRDVAGALGLAVPMRLLALHAPGGGLLVIGRDTSQIAYLRYRVALIVALSWLTVVLGVGLAAIGLSIAPVRRTRHLTLLAARIAAGELALRMPVSPRGDELDVIAATVNAMVEEIVRLLEQVKGATDAIAHDLRAPLALVRGRLDRLRRAAAEGLGAGDATLDSAVADLDVVLARFNALLRIAELEASNRRAGFAPLDPMSLASQVCELFEPLAEERGIRLALTGEWGHILQGDQRLLFEALSNLVENAIKFIAEQGGVALSVHAEARGIVIAVRDDGRGIPPEERAGVLRRFHRGSGARHAPGSGLGLSLVAAIAHLHGFALELEDAGPGLLVRLVCPVDEVG